MKKRQFNLPLVVTIGIVLMLDIGTSHADVVYVGSTANNVVYRYAASYPITNSTRAVFASIVELMGMAFDSAGNFYVTFGQSSQIIEKFSPSGVDLGQFANARSLTGGVGNIYALAFDGANNLYASLQGNPNLIIKFTTNGVGSIFVNAGSSVTPFDIAFDSAGNLYAANYYGTNIVEKYSPSGVDLGSFAQINLSGASGATGLAFDSAGNFYVAIQNPTPRIEKFNSAGVDQGVFGANGLEQPFEIAIDSQGYIYVTYDGLGTVEVFPPGGQSGLYASLPYPGFIAIQPGFLNRPILPPPTPPAPPNLKIIHSGASVVLTWPTNFTGFTLQSTTNLVLPAVWITNAPAPVVVNTNNTVTNSISGTRKFYRLSQ
jgi:sugar lactone lactonase YvrE